MGSERKANKDSSERSTLETIADGVTTAVTPSMPASVALAIGLAAAFGIGAYVVVKRLTRRASAGR